VGATIVRIQDSCRRGLDELLHVRRVARASDEPHSDQMTHRLNPFTINTSAMAIGTKLNIYELRWQPGK
jgi:hypothetical protein